MTVLKGFDKRGLHDYIFSQSKRGGKTMSAPKGFYRLALVLNLIAIMAAFYVGYSLHHKTWRFANWPWSFDNWISVIWGCLFAFIPFFILIYVIRHYGPEGFKRFIENIIRKMNLAQKEMNLTQKIIIGLSVGLIFFILFLAIESTRFMWIIFVIFLGYFEYKLFS